MRTMMLAAALAGCGGDEAARYEPEEFGALVESLGSEYSAGYLIILNCAAAETSKACEDLTDGYLRTDYGTMVEAKYRCTHAPGSSDLVILGYSDACSDTAGEQVPVSTVECVPQGPVY